MGDVFHNIVNRALNKVGLGEVFAQLVSPTSANGVPPRRGTREFLLAYNDMPHLRAIVNKIGKSVGTVCWRVYVQNNGDGQAMSPSRRMYSGDYDARKAVQRAYMRTNNLKEILNHPMLEMLEDGNNQLLGHTCMQVTQTHLELVGEAYWLLERNAFGAPVAYWPLPPDWVAQLPTSEVPFYAIHFGNIQEFVPKSEIVRFVDPDPSNPYGRGSGISMSLSDELETDEYAAKHLKQYFFNSARPELVVVGQNLSRDDTKRLQESWERRHRGFMNAFRAHFINRQVDIKTITPTFESMQFTNMRKQERDIIQQTFGIPPEKLGILSASNRSTIAAADIFWRNDIIMPRLELMRATMQKFLVPMYDERLVIDYELPQILDDEFKLQVMSRAPWAHYINEWRALSGHDTLGPDGNTLMVPVNMASYKIDELGGSAEDDNEPVPDDEDTDQDNENADEEGTDEGNEQEMMMAALNVDNLSKLVSKKIKELGYLPKK